MEEKTFAVTEREEAVKGDPLGAGTTEQTTKDTEAGDSQAPVSFESLYWQSLPHLERVAWNYFDKKEDVEDALQETYLRIFEKLDQLRSPEAFTSWAITLCNRVCSNKARSHSRHVALDDPRPPVTTDEELGIDILPAAEYRKDINPGQHADAAHVSDVVTEVLDSLPEDQQNCLLLWMADYTNKEIAEELSMNPSTVRSNIYYAKSKVRKTLTRMQREGTFDYKKFAADPMGAFLRLAAEYFGTARAVSTLGDSLLASLELALGAAGLATAAGLVSGGATGGTTPVTAGAAAGTGGTVAAKSGIAATLQKVARDPLTSVIAVVLVVALAIGIAVGLQAYSTSTPVNEQNEATTRSAVERTPSDTESEAQTTAPQPGPGPAGENATVTAPAAAPANTAGAGPAVNAPANAAAANPLSNLIRADGTLTAYRTADTDATTVNDMQETEQNLTGGLTNLISNWQNVTVAFDKLVNYEGYPTINMFLGNYTGYPVHINKLQYVQLKDANGNTVLNRVTFVPNESLNMANREEITLRLSYPEGYYNKAYLPAMKDATTYDDTGMTIYCKPDYTITSGITDFVIKQVTGVDESDSVYKRFTRDTGQIPFIYIVDMNETADALEVTLGVKNPTEHTLSLTRFEYFRLYGVTDQTLAEGRAKLPSPVKLPPEETRYFVITIPSSNYKNFNFLTGFAHMEDVMYDVLD